jgi:GAF domain-containing protein
LSTILDQEQLTREVVNQLQQAFNYYHVNIYLFDNARRDLLMAGGTGEAGQVMLARGHKIIAGRGLVGRAADTNQPVLVSDTTQDPGWLPNPLLPKTKSELAIPIASGDRVLGVLDVQQNIIDGLTLADVDLIQLVANQLAIALQNAWIYMKSQQRAEHEAMIVALSHEIQQATTVEDVLKVAVSGLGQRLGAQRSSIELRSQAADGKN